MHFKPFLHNFLELPVCWSFIKVFILSRNGNWAPCLPFFQYFPSSVTVLEFSESQGEGLVYFWGSSLTLSETSDNIFLWPVMDLVFHCLLTGVFVEAVSTRCPAELNYLRAECPKCPLWAASPLQMSILWVCTAFWTNPEFHVGI